MSTVSTLPGDLRFHHLGVATRGITKAEAHYQCLGYTREASVFEDPAQGIRGLFLVADNQPRLELLENLENSSTLDNWLARGPMIYHMAYLTADITATITALERERAKLVKAPTPAVAFDGRQIAFLMLPNQSLIELIEG